jgi:hypothetical protein
MRASQGVEKDTSASLLRKIQTLAYDRIRVSPESFLRLAAASFSTPCF